MNRRYGIPKTDLERSRTHGVPVSQLPPRGTGLRRLSEYNPETAKPAQEIVRKGKLLTYLFMGIVILAYLPSLKRGYKQIVR